ncbi:PAS domain S-box protein [Methanoregula sp.]|jgi:PAS domain S-box-containing protein|uniref:PAS domain S-box protein n=1 Tax=Methanoregula sp. TaxID=2052170 RepID=UPI003C202284
MYSLLYVDDEPGLLEIGQLFLESTGEFTVRTVQSGEKALDLISHTDFDAVISDYQMPEMDGIELLKTVRKTFGNIPFILFTGRGREEIVIEAINNGVDSYLQKGGDPKAQFAELAHRVRQAIRRRTAETALSDSERRLSDIINFLPDATFAIDTEGNVIAWNQAIEEMTGIPAGEMLGKGNYEYAIPFYGTRRPILIDLVFEPDEKIADYYINLQREGNAISAETSLPHPKGKRIDALGKASPLYNRDGEITGAIEAIRDISDRKQSEEELQVQYNELVESEKRIRESEIRLGYMIGFYERAQKREKEILDYAVAGAGIITGSPLGYLAFLNDDESELSMYAWSKEAMAECSMRDKPIVYKTEKTGLWGEAVRQRRPVITNNYDAPDPKKKGYPDGHPRIIRHMNVPIMEEGHIVLVAGVANKPSDYTDRDAHELILLMQGLWTIIKRKRAEQTQQESEAKYRSLVEHAPVGMHFYDLMPSGALVFTRANPGADLILGIDNSRFAGKTIGEAFPGLEGTEIPDRYRDVAAHGGIWQTEQVEYDNGKIRSAYAVTAFQIFTGSMVAMFTDITERKRTEMELQAVYEQITASEEELRDQYNALSSAHGEIQERRQQMEEIAATVPGVVFQFYARPDGSMGVYYASSRALEILGIDTDAGEFFPVFVSGLHPDDRSRFMDSVHNAVKTAAPWDFTGRFIKPSGETIWFHGTSSPVRHGDELVYSGVIKDTTDQKRAAEALEESERRYRSLIETTNTGYVILDDEGRVLEANPEYVRLTGHRDLSEIIGRSVVEWTAASEADKNAAAVRQCVHDGFIRNFEIDYTDAAGHITPIEINATVVHEEGKCRIITLCREISDRRKAETAMRESEERYRLLAENSPDMIYFIDADGFVRYVNEFAAISMRARPGDLVGKHVNELFSPEIAGPHLEEILKVIANRQPSHREIFEILPAGGIWLDVHLSPLIDETGTVLGVLGLSHDISERKNAEEALVRLSRLDQEALDVAKMGHFEFDVATQTFIFNDQYYRLIGTTADKAGGYRMPAARFTEQFIHPENTHFVEESIRAGIETPDSQFERRFESRIIRPDGTIIWVEVWFRIEKDDGGKTIRFYGVNQDITERKNAEEALQESEMKYRMLVESSNDIIYTLNGDGVFTFVSPSWTTLLGHPTEDVVGKSFHQFVHPQDIPACDAFFANVVRTRERQTGVVYRAYHADGSIHIHTSNISPVMDAQGTVVAYIGNARDITDMKRSENAIRESNRKLNLLNSITRHDLANQLTVVQGYTQLATLRKPDPIIAEFIAKIDQAAEMMEWQIEFTRNYQDLGVQAPAWHRVNEVVMAAKPQNIALTCACDTIEVFADPMIGKVFFNLFDNAIRHGEKVSAITVHCGLVSEELVITVEDNGIGIPLDEKQKIFAKGYGKHTGFGLFLVREILAITGIFIHETGSHGKGARFEIAVPKGAYWTGKGQ